MTPATRQRYLWRGASRGRALVLTMLVMCAVLVACGEVPDSAEHMPGRYVTQVVSFTPGEGAGYGQEMLPDVVLGPPQGQGERSASLDVLSLGRGGAIVLGFGEAEIIDGPGPDFIVFENAFWPNGVALDVYAELGEVSVSEDGALWHTFACDTSPSKPGRWPGCAGWTPTRAFSPLQTPLEPVHTGGDAFDLADLGVTRARFVRIVDVSHYGSTPMAGFDLDAIAVIHAQEGQFSAP